uniref:Serine/threonine-protein kinase ATR n=1 Tax=Sinocyclocheilus grahami TaxID=75366 RepID=A0A672LJ32_SINGR
MIVRSDLCVEHCLLSDSLLLFLNKFNLFYSSLTVHFNVCCFVRFLVAAQTRAHCVFLLALLSKSVCGDWRSSVYRWALQSNSESERASAVRGFPLLLHNLGVKSYSLIHEVLLNRLQDSSTEVKIELAGITGQLACCLSESSQLQFPQDMMPSHELLCVGLSISDSHPSQTSSIGASIIPSFLLLLKSVEDKKVKQAFIRNIRHLFKHVDLGNSDPDTKSLVSALVNLIEDPDQDVRIKFGLNIKNLLEFWNGNGFLKELLVSRLKEAYTNAKTSRNNELKNTLILTTGEIGRAAEGNLVSFALLRLLHCLLSKSNPVSVAAYTEIQALATCRHLKLQSFFNQYRNPICQFLVESLHSRHVTALRCTPDQSSEALQEEAAHQRELALDILSHVAHVFDFPDLNRFLNRTLQVLLPFLAAKASPTASALIRTIAKQLNVNRREMLINNFKYIFSHLVCSCTKEELERAFHYLKNETEIELGSLLRQDFQGLHNELLLRLGEHYQQVFNGLAILASFASSDDPYQGPREITTPGQLNALGSADYLQPKLLGILAFFNMQLLSSSAGEKEKKKMVGVQNNLHTTYCYRFFSVLTESEMLQKMTNQPVRIYLLLLLFGKAGLHLIQELFEPFMPDWGERCFNNVKYVKNNVFFEQPIMRACSTTPPKQNQDFVKEHNRTPLKILIFCFRIVKLCNLLFQELLSLFECREGRTDSPGRRLWRRFPEQVQEILEPHLNTRYKSSQKVVNWSKLKKPVYLTSRGSKFSDWSATWAAYLISKVRHELAGKVFNCCSFIIKHDYKVTIYLLPHILVYVLIGCTQEEQREVNEEMMAVLKEGDPRLVRLQENASSLSQLSTQTVFSMLDHLTQWSRHKLQSLSTNKSSNLKNASKNKVSSNSEYQSVVAFLNRIPQDVLAKASFRSRAYTRAVMHFESFIREKKQNIQDHLSFLQTMYAAMHEPDGVRGVNDLRKEEPSLREQILEHESIGLLRESTACYDRAIQLEPDQIVHYHGVMNSMLGLGQLSTVITQVNGVLASRPRWKSDLNAYRVEAAWKLSKWDLVEDYIASDCKSSTWGVRLGQMLLAGKKQDSEAFYEKLKVARKEQVVPLSAASFECGTYQRGYEYIVRLHMLCELEHAFTELQKESRDAGGSKKPEPKLNWDARLLMTQNSFRAKEPVLALRRALLSLSKGSSCEEQVGECWLQSARVARRAGHHQTAFNALLNAENSLSELFIEKAKWLWSKGDVHQALIVLQKGVQQCFPDEQPLTDPKRIQIKGNAMLLVGRYMEETANFESNAIMKTYKDVTHLLPEWEDGNFYLAKYYDKVMPMVTDNKLERQGNLIRYIVTYFGKALQFGNQYIYQAMPRMLTLWLDFGAKVYEFEKAGRSDRAQMRAELTKINSVISEHTSNLSPYQFLTAFSQLISRICHSNNEVFAVLMEIVAKVFLAYPQQAMWMMTAVSKSSYPTRMNRCKEILKKAVSLNESFGKFIGDANRLTDKLVELGNKPVDGNSSTLSMSVHFKMLKKLVEEPTFSQILIPLQSVLIPTLPSTGGANPKHDAFPGHWVYLGGFDDTVEILASLQKPKKISLKGSDGKFYTMMCKPKDDLRKDCRLMEFNCLINKSLRKDAESRRRDLHIRTYAVIPLNEECGIIEWVNNTAGVRHILTKLYKEKGIYVSGTELRKLILPKTASFQEKLKLHKDVLCARHPPVFHEWFLRTFPDPTSWYNSRSAYCRSTAVMSMVGYILGLGDRHGENILFDSLTGECVHVDFNCLFNKGETFDVPEVVPFRLTQNMVHAMGPMGTEGLFRQACEVTLRLMRDQREPLMSVLKTFLHDPLVEWSKPVKGSSKTQVNESGEILNEKAKTHVLDIDQRLQGVIKNRNKVMGLPLSIEGHAHYLIQEATDDNLLCLMYLGWGPYL